MGALRPIIREPRSTVESREAAELFIHERVGFAEAPSAPLNAMFTTDGAGVPLKGALGGGVFNPVRNNKFLK